VDDCIFCQIVRGEIPCFKVLENDRVLAFEDINPISEGHTLIIPKKHASNIWEISADDLVAVHLASRKIAQALRKVLRQEGIALLQLNGRGVNQEVLHYHLHLMPRLEGKPELPVTHWELRPGDMKAIQNTAEKIAAALS
jgi:histidine triad (HIT) family protein